MAAKRRFFVPTRKHTRGDIVCQVFCSPRGNLDFSQPASGLIKYLALPVYERFAPDTFLVLEPLVVELPDVDVADDSVDFDRSTSMPRAGVLAPSEPVWLSLIDALESALDFPVICREIWH